MPWAETIRVASFAAPLKRDGPGLLLRDLRGGEDDQIAAIVGIVATVAPDILLLTSIDFDHDRLALSSYADLLAAEGVDYPHRFTRLPNSGMATGLDMNGDGRTGARADAQGYGRFAGHGGMAVLSRWPVDEAGVIDLSSLLWRDMPGASLPQVDGRPFPSADAQAVQRLSSTAHWIVPIAHPEGTVTLLGWSATAPLFDGPEGMNVLRNRDELRLWTRVLDGEIEGLVEGALAPEGRFVILGNANLDPADGAGLQAAMQDFLADPRLQDPRPASRGAAAGPDPDHLGDPAHDTAAWARDGPGHLRVTYVLPSADWGVAGAGVFWPAPDDPLSPLIGQDGQRAGPHRLVWVDLVLPEGD
ncbi:MAG: endonuclease/exonuclease/phosphatase family protein [Rubellimicrobium sp.]|nr:endonuclease/exonuclease/phosphatase family protein [Rubellimicrobium sp.]